ncbi:hypothetical protein QS306_01515 [Paraburkholderia bonniea]|uniref:hypothetical protein n=1 Tax=Paraburkholderia bonniea TaxID=2152891 RepID=UPI001292666C|nr:hypothetical protein [Paraburkholderia bonniea]WJF90390.1 hypothetical protein QS306_01515 [Paraburkholderia bonniea]WJF93705.1 hypothetical protein QS308_01515 [Paraburkholderia bonniea]
MSAQALAQSADSLREHLVLLQSALKEMQQNEAKRAIAAGYSPASLSVGPLDQWIYVLETHLQACPPVPRNWNDTGMVVAYARYLDFLIDQIHTDARYTTEMDFRWSKIWRTQAEPDWEAMLSLVQYLLDAVPRDQRLEQIRTGLHENISHIPPKD